MLSKYFTWNLSYNLNLNVWEKTCACVRACQITSLDFYHAPQTGLILFLFSIFQLWYSSPNPYILLLLHTPRLTPLSLAHLFCLLLNSNQFTSTNLSSILQSLSSQQLIPEETRERQYETEYERKERGSLRQEKERDREEDSMRQRERQRKIVGERDIMRENVKEKRKTV